MSPKDICLIKYIEDICQMGFSALKIEGRMKSEHYIATVVNAYRKAIDKIDVSTYEKDIQNAANRETSVG
jgi:putative protease